MFRPTLWCVLYYALPVLAAWLLSLSVFAADERGCMQNVQLCERMRELEVSAAKDAAAAVERAAELRLQHLPEHQKHLLQVYGPIIVRFSAVVNHFDREHEHPEDLYHTAAFVYTKRRFRRMHRRVRQSQNGRLRGPWGESRDHTMVRLYAPVAGGTQTLMRLYEGGVVLVLRTRAACSHFSACSQPMVGRSHISPDA